jgi:hypothetical protein
MVRSMSEASAPPPGFFSDATGRRRWWDGTAWTEHVDEADLATAPDGRLLDAGQRRAILDRAVTTYVGHGYRVESNTGVQAVITKRQRVNVLLNVALVVVTGGVWLVFLALRLLNWPVDRVVLTVQPTGELVPEFS